jgi:hypothetical protein
MQRFDDLTQKSELGVFRRLGRSPSRVPRVWKEGKQKFCKKVDRASGKATIVKQWTGRLQGIKRSITGWAGPA